jgi:hypothetical protein
VHVEDAVGVDVERDLDPRHAARGRRDVGEVEAAEQQATASADGGPTANGSANGASADEEEVVDAEVVDEQK